MSLQSELDTYKASFRKRAPAHAQEIMSKQFVDILSATLLNYPWASPVEHSGCSLLVPPTDRRYEPGCGTLVENGLKDENNYFYMKPVYSTYQYTGKLKLDYEWEATKETRQRFEYDISHHTWAPWDYLITALSLQAIKRSVKKYNKKSGEQVPAFFYISRAKSLRIYTKLFFLFCYCKSSFDSRIRNKTH